jgi:hypothetical protein
VSACQCDERLKTTTEESTRLSYTGFLGELEHLQIKTRLIDEKFASVMGECDLDLRVIRKPVALARTRTTLILSCEEDVTPWKWNW